MAGTLHHLIPADTPQRLGEQLARAGAGFGASALARSAGADFDTLPLMARGLRLAEALAEHLPTDFAQAAPLLVASMGQPMGLDAKGEPVAAGDVPSGFFYLPHSLFVAQQGLNHLDRSGPASPARFDAALHRRVQLAPVFANPSPRHLGPFGALGHGPQCPCAPRRERSHTPPPALGRPSERLRARPQPLSALARGLARRSIIETISSTTFTLDASNVPWYKLPAPPCPGTSN